jgi:hypothetical protein
VRLSTNTGHITSTFNFSFKDAVFHTVWDGAAKASPSCHERDINILNGNLDANGGKVTVKNSNGTFPDTTITYAAPTAVSNGSVEYFANATAAIDGKVSAPM